MNKTQTAPAPADRLRGRYALWAILAAYAVFAVAVAVIVPTEYTTQVRLTPPDETAHLAIVQYICEHRALPVFSGGAGLYEAHQPPLFYVSCVPLYIIGELLGGGHIARLGIVLLRLWSAAWGGITVWAVWMLAGRLLGARPLASAVDSGQQQGKKKRAKAPAPASSAWADRGLWGQIGATALAALLPGRVFVTAAVSNDAMSEAFCALGLLVCVIVVLEGNLSLRRAVLLGIVVGFALLTKTNSLVLLPMAGLALLLVLRRPEGEAVQDPRALGRNAAIAIGCVVALWGWWVARNMMLYGEPLAMKVFVDVFGKDRPGPDYFAKLGMSGGQYFTLVITQTALSYWGVFGQADVFMSRAFYAIGGLLTVAAAVGLVSAGLRRRSGEMTPGFAERSAWLLVWVQLLLTAALFLRFNVDFFQAQGRYLFPATGALACVFAKGWGGFRSRWSVPAVTVALAILAIWALVAFATGDIHSGPDVLGG